MSRNQSAPTGRIVPLSLGHACVDIYQGAVAALVPFLVIERSYTYAAASGVVLAATLLSSVVQPVFGMLADKRTRPWLLPASALLAGVGVALVGVSGSYPLTLAFVAVSGIGVAAYHPEAARLARLVSRGSHTAMGWFSLGGNVGFAAAPPLVAGAVAVGGLRASPLLVVPAIVGAALCVLARPRGPGQHRDGLRRGQAAGTRTPHPPGLDDWVSFGKLSGAIVCRSIVFVGLSTFIALHASQRTGWGMVSGTVALFVLYVGAAAGTVTGGALADRYGRLPVVRWSYALTCLAVAGVVIVPGPPLYLFVALASAGLYVPFSLHLTLGQDYLPGRVGTAAGVTLGLAVSVGGVATPLVGALADATSLRIALVPLAALPLVGWLFLRNLREPDVPGGPDAPGESDAVSGDPRGGKRATIR
ncbi:MFS transporter [Plantactinospora sp. GCM10030261]|uniref:MFS transporter n=1 Tax=Plantactinospora sp. GCM10030261 TaxID=3273420 RepID=UPI00361D328C